MTAITAEPAARGVTPRNTLDGWQQHGLCRYEDPDLFFPVGDSHQARQDTEHAKQVCAPCPVRETCLEWAVSTGQWVGVWGGLSETDRADLYKVAGETQFAQCLARQALIERRMGEGISQRAIAAELGVVTKTLRKALAHFAAERAQLDAAVEEVAA
jgi:WhiB family redox-sensing transcriptional regulator